MGEGPGGLSVYYSAGRNYNSIRRIPPAKFPAIELITLIDGSGSPVVPLRDPLKPFESRQYWYA